MKLTPLFDYVLIKRKEEEKMHGLLHIPSTAQQGGIQQAEVLACGSGRVLEDGSTLPMTVKPGNIVLIPRTGMDLKFEGEDFVMIQEYQILAVISE